MMAGWHEDWISGVDWERDLVDVKAWEVMIGSTGSFM